MKIGELSAIELDQRLRSGLMWRVGPFNVRLRTAIPEFIAPFHRLYAHHRWLAPSAPEVMHFHPTLHPGTGLRRWWRPQVRFELDGLSRQAPFPRDHALPLFEWGFNHGIASRAHQYLMLHAAVVARGAQALLLPGIPGSGKSTLCAALMLHGWRLLSDEFALIAPATGLLHPLPRPIALKNEAIDIIAALDPAARLGPVFPKTRKGRVAHLQPTAASVATEEEPARPTWVVCPKFLPKAKAELTPVPGDFAFLRLSGNAFNYEMKGASGFATVARMIRSCPIQDLTFGDLTAAVALLEAWTRETPPP
ncbi:MAG: HprK-related kinase A [Magnetococcales bacterium]|nr:HprK-related kinase A [Magnetococcales bacterium]